MSLQPYTFTLCTLKHFVYPLQIEGGMEGHALHLDQLSGSTPRMIYLICKAHHLPD